MAIEYAIEPAQQRAIVLEQPVPTLGGCVVGARPRRDVVVELEVPDPEFGDEPVDC